MKKALTRIANEFGDFFRDDHGNNSMTRLCTLILVIGGLVFCFIYPHEWYGGLTICGLGITGKITQKKLSETK